MRRAFGLIALSFCLLFSACTSAPTEAVAGDDSSPSRVIFMDYRQGKSFELVNEAHTDRVELYSKVRADPTTKVASNEVMAALLDYLRSSGFYAKAHAGVAPRSSSVYQWGGEIETPAGTLSLMVNEQTPNEQRKMFIDCYMNHVQLWSNIFQLQRVDASPDEVFKQPELGR